MNGRSVLWLLLVVLSAAAPRAAHAQTTGLYFDSQPGDYIGQGHPWSYSTANATFSTDTASGFGTTISLDVAGPPFVRWTMMFQAAGQPPGVGVYDAARQAGSSTRFAGLFVFGDGRGCGPTGRFVVLEAVYAGDGSVTRFAADFEQHCGVQDAALFGAVRYNSTVSTLVPFGGAYPIRGLTVPPPAHGSVQGDGINCGSSGSQCGVTLPAPASAALTAVPDPGFVFAGWSGDCSGGPHTSVRLNMQKACTAAFTPLIPGAPRTLAVITGAANSVIGGTPVVVSPANSLWTLSPWGNGFQVRFEFVGPGTSRAVWFSITPPTGELFEIGREYQGASSPDATHGSFWGTSDSTGCSGDAVFTVRDWAAGSGGVPARFAIDFRQSCAGAGDLYGTLQYASTFAYGRIDVANTALQFTAVLDQAGIVRHSADQIVNLSPSAPSTLHWEVKSDQSWLTAAPPSGTSGTIAARIRTGATVDTPSPVIGHLQVFARGIVNVPDQVTVTLAVVAPDTTVRPFGVFRPVGGGWFLPGQAAQQLGQPGDIPLSGDFDGDATPDIAVYRPGTGEWFAQGQATRQWGLVGDIPVPADYNGDGITDLAVFRQSGPFAQWFIAGEPAPRTWGLRGDVPVPGDYDGDGLADLAIFRPAIGTWWIVRSSTGQTVPGALGQPGDIPLVADFDGDRKIDLAVFRPSSGSWYIAQSVNGFSYQAQFGLPGDIPVPLDVTGDGRAELRLWRPSTGTWYSCNRVTGEVSSQQYGLPGDVPVMARPGTIGSRPADLDGDRRADVAIYRPSTGQWFTRRSATGYGSFTTDTWGVGSDIPVPGDYDGDRVANPAVFHPPTGEWSVRRFDGSVLRRTWGAAGDLPVAADYDGDGRTDMALYRPSTGEWFILTSASDYTVAWTFTWGVPGAGDRPVPADFDGDGRADAAVYRPSTGDWLIAPWTGGWFVRQWGLPGDIPIARDYDGDGRADLAVFRPATGEWFVLDPNAGTIILTRQWGLNGDVPVADDYDGDGAADLAVYRPATSEWFVQPSSGAAPFVLQWGLAGDVLVTRR